MSIKELKQKINFRQPKYMLPAILYFPLLGASYLIFDLFTAKKAELPDTTMQTTEYLNPELPGATIKNGDGIGNKMDNMSRSFTNATDYTAVDNIDRDQPQDNKEEYESKYTENDIAQIGQQEQGRDLASQEAEAKAREAQAFAELEKVLAEARLKGQQTVSAQTAQQPSQSSSTKEKTDETKGMENDGEADNRMKMTAETKHVKDEDATHEVVRKVKTSSDYFNTLSKDEHEPTLIKAIIDENVKATEGTRVRLRLLDDVEIGDMLVRRGTYLYATMSGFSSQRVKGTIQSIMVDDEIVKVNLSLYDTDGMEGLYVPGSQFRETTKDVASGAAQGNMTMSTNTGNSLSQWGMQTVQNAYQKTTNAIGKAIKKNKVKLKYGTFVYIINSKERRESK